MHEAFKVFLNPNETKWKNHKTYMEEYKMINIFEKNQFKEVLVDLKFFDCFKENIFESSNYKYFIYFENNEYRLFRDYSEYYIFGYYPVEVN